MENLHKPRWPRNAEGELQPATKLELAAGDRFHWTKPAYELLAQCAAAQIEQALPAVAAGKNGKKP
jgi:glycerol uptake facilitator-like aquaporin